MKQHYLDSFLLAAACLSYVHSKRVHQIPCDSYNIVTKRASTDLSNVFSLGFFSNSDLVLGVSEEERSGITCSFRSTDEHSR